MACRIKSKLNTVFILTQNIARALLQFIIVFKSDPLWINGRLACYVLYYLSDGLVVVSLVSSQVLTDVCQCVRRHGDIPGDCEDSS